MDKWRHGTSTGSTRSFLSTYYHQYYSASNKNTVSRTPKPYRWDILRFVQTMWEQINHARIAERGYQQTGPTMPLEGPVSRSDVQEDLLTVFDKIEAPAGDVVGVQMRDDAVAYVNKLYNEGLLKVWDDVHLLIEQHDGETDHKQVAVATFQNSPSSG